MQDIFGLASGILIPFLSKILAAIVVWVVGGWIIGLLLRVLVRALHTSKVEATLTRYIAGGAEVVLRVLVIIAALGILGIETTSFAALLAAVGVAIGVAWGGLLANFAAGLFLILLRPFRVGDIVTAAGVTGSVSEIGLFMTMVDTADNVRVFLGNNSIFAGSIQNYTANPYRRVDLTAQVAHTANTAEVIQKLRERLAQVPNVLVDPAPSVEMLQLTPGGPLLAVRPFCHNQDYWQVYFDANKAIAEVIWA